MFPPGFLGTRADILTDIVTLSFIIILPLLVWSWRRVPGRAGMPAMNVAAVTTPPLYYFGFVI